MEIELTQGYVSYIDPIDADLAESKWTLARRDGSIYGYRMVSEKQKRIAIMLHREILSRMLGRPLLRSEYVDHKDCDGLNNRRENLRLATCADNQHNSRRRRDNKTGYKGVSWDKRRQKYVARIRFNFKRQFLGYFDTPLDAHKVYCAAAADLFGEFARAE